MIQFAIDLLPTAGNLIFVEPYDLRNDVSGYFPCFQSQFDLERLLVHFQYPRAKTISRCRSNEMCRWVILLHAGQRKQPLTLLPGYLDGSSLAR